MKKNFVVSFFAGVALVLTACGSAKMYTDLAMLKRASDKDVEVIEDNKAPTSSDIVEDADSEGDNEEVTESKAAYGGVISNDLFSIIMPQDTEGTYIYETTNNSIIVYDKEANEAGFLGFVFSVEAYESPDEYAGGMDMKVGEFVTDDGTVYDVTRTYASDVQWDYTKGEEMPESYAKLYNDADEIIKKLVPVSGTYTPGAGTKGDELYGDVISFVKSSIVQNWDAAKLEENNLSSMYYSIAQENDPLEKIGYAYRDINNDGIDELLIGEITDGEMKGVIYDVFTMHNREPMHVVSGYYKDRYFALEYGMLVNEKLVGVGIEQWTTIDVVPNTGEINKQVDLKIDTYENEKEPYFVSYGMDEEDWQNISEDNFDMYKDRMVYVRQEYTPFSEA